MKYLYLFALFYITNNSILYAQKYGSIKLIDRCDDYEKIRSSIDAEKKAVIKITLHPDGYIVSAKLNEEKSTIENPELINSILECVKNYKYEKSNNADLFYGELSVKSSKKKPSKPTVSKETKNKVYTSLESALKNPSLVYILDLSGQKLTQLPPFIKQFTNLQTLNLSNNQLTSLPESIGSLDKLNNLYLSSNQLTTLPKSIFRYNLNELYLDNNPLILELKLLEKLSPFCTVILRN